MGLWLTQQYVAAILPDGCDTRAPQRAWIHCLAPLPPRDHLGTKPAELTKVNNPEEPRFWSLEKKVRSALAKQPADLELVTIYEISKILSSSLDFHKTVQDVLNVLLSHLHMHHGVVSLVQDAGKLHVVGASGSAREPDQPLELDAAESVWARSSRAACR